MWFQPSRKSPATSNTESKLVIRSSRQIAFGPNGLPSRSTRAGAYTRAVRRACPICGDTDPCEDLRLRGASAWPGRACRELAVFWRGTLTAERPECDNDDREHGERDEHPVGLRVTQ